MTNPILLSNAEIAAVAGGAISQISVSATLSSSSSVTQAATATNTGGVTAATTGTLVLQANLVAAFNKVVLAGRPRIAAVVPPGQFAGEVFMMGFR